MALGGTGNGESSNYENKYSLQFRRGAKDDKPYFQVRQYAPDKVEMENVNKVSGNLKGIFYNMEKDIITKLEGKEVTIPANFSVSLEDGDSIYYVSISVEDGMQLRATLNSLLSANKGDRVELSAYVAKGKYKVIGVANPDKKKEISFERDGETKTATVNESYSWAVDMKDIPEVEITKNKKGEIVDIDDVEATKFFKDKIEAKFNPQSEETTSNGGDISVEDIPF